MSEQKTELEKKTVTITYFFYFGEPETNTVGCFSLELCDKQNFDNNEMLKTQQNFIDLLYKKTGKRYVPISYYEYSKLADTESEDNMLVRAAKWITKKLRN